jgi:hypothetical protein
MNGAIMKIKEKRTEYTFEIPEYIYKEFESAHRILFPIELVTVPIPWEMLREVKKLEAELKEKDLVLVPVPRSMVK